jgi:hypothetical protein
MKTIYQFTQLMILIVMFNMINSCQDFKRDTYSTPENNSDSTRNSAFKAAPGRCYCDPTYKNPHCEDCVAGDDGIMKGFKTKSYSVTWTNCNTNDPNWTNCGSPIPPTQLTFCYGDPSIYGNPSNCELYLTIENPPPCMRCITHNPFCEKMVARCVEQNGNTEVTFEFMSGGVFGQIEYMLITGDPQIKLRCNAYGSNGIEYWYECTGEF